MNANNPKTHNWHDTQNVLEGVSVLFIDHPVGSGRILTLVFVHSDDWSLFILRLLADSHQHLTFSAIVWMKPGRRERNKRDPPHHLPLSLSVAWGVENCLRCAFRITSCSALLTHDPCCAFACIHVASSWNGAYWRLDSLLRRVPCFAHVRGSMTEIYFWCFSSSEQYFLCLIIKKCILASSAYVHHFNIIWHGGWVVLQAPLSERAVV